MTWMTKTSKDPTTQLLLRGFEREQGGHHSRLTMLRRLQVDGLRWPSKQPEPCLTEGHQAARLAVARREASPDRTCVLSSDECSNVLLPQISKG